MKKVLFMTAIAAVVIFSVMLVVNSYLVTSVTGLETSIALDEDGNAYVTRNDDGRSLLFAIDKEGRLQRLYTERDSLIGGTTTFFSSLLTKDRQVYLLRTTVDIETSKIVRQEICEFISFSDFGGYLRVIYSYDGLDLVKIDSLTISDDGYMNVTSISEDSETVYVDRINYTASTPGVAASISKAAPFNNGLYHAAYVNGALIGITRCGELVRFEGNTCTTVYDGGGDSAILFLAPSDDGVLFVNSLTRSAYKYQTSGNILTDVSYQDFSAGSDPQMTDILAAAAVTSNNFVCLRTDASDSVSIMFNDGSTTNMVSELTLPISLDMKFSLLDTMWYTLIAFAVFLIIWLFRMMSKSIRKVLAKFLMITVPTVAILFIVFGLVQQYLMRETLENTRGTMSREINVQNLQRIDTDLVAGIDSPSFYKTADYRQLRSMLKTDGTTVSVQNVTTSLSIQNEIVVYRNGTMYTAVSEREPCYYSARLVYSGTGIIEMMREAVDTMSATSATVTNQLGDWNAMCSPIIDLNGSVVGFLLTTVSTGDIQSQLNDNYMTYLLVTLVTLILLTTFMFLLFKMALKPLKQIEQAVERVAAGDYSTSLTVKSNDEFYDISRVFNRMCEELSTHIYKINSLSRSYYRFVPRNVYGMLGRESILDVNFGDIANIDSVFAITALNNRDKIRSEHNDAEFMSFTNSYFSVLYRYIEQNRGLLLSNDFNMSSLMSIYRESADDAMSFSIDFLNELAAGSVAGSGITADATVMLHSASLLYGIAGTEQRVFPFTTSAEADYLSELTQKFKHMRARLIITKDVLEKLKQTYVTRYIGFVHTPDAKNTYQLYEVLDVYDARSIKARTDVIPVFDKALSLFYDADFYGARNLFSAILRTCPDDGIARWYLFACDRYFTYGSNENMGYELFGQNSDIFGQ